MNLCEVKSHNTGLGDCDIKLGVPEILILCARSSKIDPAQANDLMGYLVSKTVDPNPSTRFYPIRGAVRQVTDNSTEPNMGSLDSGYQEQTSAGQSIFLFEWPSRLCSDKAINRFNDMDYGAYIINRNGLLFGLSNEDGSLSPFNVYLSVYGGGFSGSGTTLQTKKMLITFGDQLVMQNGIGLMKFRPGTRIDNLNGLQDAVLNAVSVSGTTASIQVISGCSRENLSESYSEELDEISLWKATDTLTGAEVTPSGVTYNAQKKAFDMAGLTAGTEITVSLVSVDLLAEAGFAGYEGVPVNVNVPPPAPQS